MPLVSQLYAGVSIRLSTLGICCFLVVYETRLRKVAVCIFNPVILKSHHKWKNEGRGLAPVDEGE